MKNPDEQLKIDSDRDPVHPPLQSWIGWSAIVHELRASAAGRLAHHHQAVVAVECGNRVNSAFLLADLRSALPDAVVLDCHQTLKIQSLIDTLIAPWLEPHSAAIPCPLAMKQFLDADRLEAFAKSLAEHLGLVVVAGPGASCCCHPDILVYADNASETNENNIHPSDAPFSDDRIYASRTELDLHQRITRRRRIDTPVARHLADQTRPHWNYLLNINRPDAPGMVAAADLWPVIRFLASIPFIWKPKVPPHEWKIGDVLWQSASSGAVDIRTANGLLPIHVDHLFSCEGISLLGTAGAAVRRFTGLCPGEILMRVVTEDIFGGGMYNKESPVKPDFIARDHLAIDGAVQFRTHDSMHILWGTEYPVQIEYWSKIPENSPNRPPDGKRTISSAEAIIIPANVEFFRLNPEGRRNSRGGPILYHWALGTVGDH